VIKSTAQTKETEAKDFYRRWLLDRADEVKDKLEKSKPEEN